MSLEQMHAEIKRRAPGTAWWDDMRACDAPPAKPTSLRPMQKHSRGNAVYPYPAIAAQLSDGSEIRLSVYVDKRKPDMVAAERSAHAIARARGLGVVSTIITGHAMPAPKVAKETAAQKLKAIVEALKAGEIEQACRLAERA